MNPGELHSRKPVFRFGTVQIVMGILLIIMDIVTFSLTGLLPGLIFTMGASGIWMGIWFIITGSLGVAAGRPLLPGYSVSNRKCPLIACMVMGILAIFGELGLLIRFTIWARAFGATTTELSWDPDASQIGAIKYRAYIMMTVYSVCHAILLITTLGQAVAAGINVCKFPRTATPVTYVTTTTVPYPAGVTPYGHSLPAGVAPTYGPHPSGPADIGNGVSYPAGALPSYGQVSYAADAGNV